MTDRELGRTGIRVSPIGLGTMQFAGPSRISSSMYPAIPQAQIDLIIQAALDGGIASFDTAQMYGNGHAERSLVSALTSAGVQPGDVTVATKWNPLGRTAHNIEETIGDRISALSPFPIGLHMIHLNFGSLSTVSAQINAMARLVETDKIGSVGVSGFSARQMEISHRVLQEHGIPLATNQVQINLLNRKIETNGVLDTARRLGITLEAFSPLRSGMLTGKFHDDRSLVGKMTPLRRALNGFSKKRLDRSVPLIGGLKEIGAAHSATASQIALAWLITYYGETVVAIAGATKPHHAAEAAAAMGVALSQDELQRLDELSTSANG
jgi:aryl-alcohol dehydrogenase-like predicted oxidoreductase